MAGAVNAAPDSVSHDNTGNLYLNGNISVNAGTLECTLFRNPTTLTGRKK